MMNVAKVQYLATCAATCTGGEVIAAQVNVCEASGQDTAMISQMGAQNCADQVADQGCPAAQCACDIQETTTPCE